MVPNSKEWWEAKYQEQEWLHGKEPSKFLVENLKDLGKGAILDLGMGEGRNATYLASKGFQVTGVDFSETASGRAKSLAKDMGVELKVDNKDIDMYLLPLMTFNAAILIDYKPSLRFLKDINRGIKQGGTLLIDAYTTEQMKHKGGPQPEIFECYKPNEVLHNLKNVHVVFYQEREVEPDRFRVQCIARKTSFV